MRPANKRQLHKGAVRYARAHCQRGWRRCHPVLLWLGRNLFVSRMAVALVALTMLWLCGEMIDKPKVIDVCVYAFAEAAAHFFSA